MRKLFLLMLAIVTCAAVRAEMSPVYTNDDLTITPVGNGTWVVETTDKTTMYILEGADRALLIDTGTKCEKLDKVVRSITRKPVDVVATHCHYDHVGNVKYFDNVYMHPADSVLIPGGPMKDYKGKITYVREGHTFDLGGRRIDVYEMPGHTPGSIILVEEARHDAYTADAFGSGQVWLQLSPRPSVASYILTCERMMRLMEEKGIEKLWPGHYPYLKHPLGMSYMQDMITLARKVNEGDVTDARVFGEDIPGNTIRVMGNGQAEMVFDTRGPRKVCLLKLDDVHYGDNGETVPPRWERLMSYLMENNQKAGLGIIGYSLADGSQDFIDWIRHYQSQPNIEFWAHGFHNRMSMDEEGEFEKPYYMQYRSLLMTDSLARSRLGFTLSTWGPHWTAVNGDTDLALSRIPSIRMALGAPGKAVHFKGYVLETPLWMEYPVHNPDYDEFVRHYREIGDTLGCFYLQGHPNSWDDTRWENFTRIVKFLHDEGVLFVTPSEMMIIKGV